MLLKQKGIGARSQLSKPRSTPGGREGERGFSEDVFVCRNSQIGAADAGQAPLPSPCHRNERGSDLGSVQRSSRLMLARPRSEPASGQAVSRSHARANPPQGR